MPRKTKPEAAEPAEPAAPPPEPGPTYVVEHTHRHHHIHEFEQEPEVHDPGWHNELHMHGRKGVPNYETYEQDRTPIRKRKIG